MIKLLTREGMFCLLRGEQQQHGNVDKHLFRQLGQKPPDLGVAFDTVHGLKIWVDDPKADGHRVLPTPFNLCLWVVTFILNKGVQDLLDLYIRFCTTIYPRHSYNRPSTHVMISIAASTKAFASCAAIVPGAYRMSVGQELTRAKCGTTDGGILAPPVSAYRCSSHS